jgi:hypothetical protein
MAEAGLFLGWGAPILGREAKGLDVFNEAIGYYGRLQEGGAIESFETVILDPHGGDLAGFFLIRGSAEQMSRLRSDEEFERLTTRASLVVEGLGVVGAALGDGLGRSIGIYEDAVGELT